ncbi:hypothetical protein BU15DRAFT_70369 [Melanogaster broomeanus]|nr:hypothetical protein BU15DRAFT_70369 [Melanogaster broomeanus]
MVVSERKTKKPPTFQYLPKNRAKKLKKSWIENKKLKSKWKAQKRKEGLLRESAPRSEGNPGQDYEETKSGSDSDTPSQSHSDYPEDDLATSERTLAAPQKEHSAATPSNAQKTFREQKRQAYSPGSRHTPKVDPLDRNKASASRGISHRTRGGRGGGFADRGRNKGQPNMKLRMNIMLEKIQRDFS